jgi:hypothetical protein
MNPPTTIAAAMYNAAQDAGGSQDLPFDLLEDPNRRPWIAAAQVAEDAAREGRLPVGPAPGASKEIFSDYLQGRFIAFRAELNRVLTAAGGDYRATQVALLELETAELWAQRAIRAV